MFKHKGSWGTKPNSSVSLKSGSEWAGGRIPLPLYLGQGEPQRAELLLRIEQPGERIVWFEVSDPTAPAPLSEALRRAMARPLVGPPRRPARIRVAGQALATELRSAVPEIPTVEAPTPEPRPIRTLWHDGRMRPAAKVRCPYCGEKLWMEADADEGSTVAEFIADCEVCCRPIVFSGYFDERGRLRLSARTDS